MVQKFIPNKGELSYTESIVISDPETGEMICQNCGRILQEKISDIRKETIAFTEFKLQLYFLKIHLVINYKINFFPVS